jgi:hypothetical protein
MCFGGGSYSPPPPPPKIEALPTPPAADLKQQAAPASATADAGTGSKLMKKTRRMLTISSAIGTPGLGA